VALGGAAAAQRPGFEVASIRQNTTTSTTSGIAAAPGRFTIANTPLGFIVLDAYQLLGHQLVDTPDWIWTTAYDVTATYPGGVKPDDARVREMLQQLLEERFQLRVRRETRELPAYRLLTARSDGRLGPRLVRSNVDCEKWIAEKRPQIGEGGPSPVPGGRRPACMMSANRRGFLTGGTRTMKELALTLQSFVERPVVDSTTLAGTFDVDLIWDSSTDPGGRPAAAADGVSLFTALQEQLGLRLESGRNAFEVVVIERIEPPSPD
jgi:uncharacterized protein (TIGR03435 family)